MTQFYTAVNEPQEVNELDKFRFKISVGETISIVNKVGDFLNKEEFSEVTTETPTSTLVLEVAKLLSNDNDIDTVVKKIYEGIKDISLPEMVRDIRKLGIIINKGVPTSGFLLQRVCLLLVAAYNQGRVEGYNADTGEVYLSDQPTASDYVTIISLLAKRQGIDAGMAVVPEDYDDLLVNYLGLDSAGFVDYASSNIEVMIQKLKLNYLMVFQTEFNSFFKYTSPDVFSPIHLTTSFLTDRGDIANSALIQLLPRIMESIIGGTSAIYKRPNSHGNQAKRMVTTDQTVPWSMIQYKETHADGLHLVDVTYTDKQNNRSQFWFDLENADYAYQTFTGEMDAVIFLQVLSFMGLTQGKTISEARVTFFAKALFDKANKSYFRDLTSYLQFVFSTINGVLDQPANVIYSGYLMNFSNWESMTDHSDDYETPFLVPIAEPSEHLFLGK